MSKYLFCTYGEPGWRGVQMRALRIANYLPKTEVIFWNLYDSEPIRQWGFTVETKPSGFHLTEEIVFPKDVRTVIFADLPTNEPFLYSTFLAAKKAGLNVVVCDQLYRTRQLKEFVFDSIITQADLFLANSLSFLQSEETATVKIVPPQVEVKPQNSIREKVRKKYNIPENYPILFGSAYHPKIYKKITLFINRLREDYGTFSAVISTPENTITGNDYFEVLQAADVVLVKFGFLQILESLALRKPTIVFGEPGQLLQDKTALDPRLSHVLHLEDDEEEMYERLKRLTSDTTYRNREIKQISKLHNGELFGAKKAAEYIRLLKPKRRPHIRTRKKLAILINNEILEKKQWLSEQSDMYPLCFTLPSPQEQEIIKRIPQQTGAMAINQVNSFNRGELLPHSFHELHVFSRRKYDGLTGIDHWYDDWIDHIKALIDSADEIYVSDLGLKFFQSLIPSKKIKHLA